MAVLWYNDGSMAHVVTSPILKSYQKHMKGVDVADQLQGYYNVQQPTHKWWHIILFFSLGYVIGKFFMLYKAYMRERSTKSLFHLKYQLEVADSLTKPLRVLECSFIGPKLYARSLLGTWHVVTSNGKD